MLAMWGNIYIKSFKVTAPCRLLGEYRGAAHQFCNLIVRNSQFDLYFLFFISLINGPHLFIKRLLSQSPS